MNVNHLLLFYGGYASIWPATGKPHGSDIFPRTQRLFTSAKASSTMMKMKALHRPFQLLNAPATFLQDRSGILSIQS